MRVHIDTFDVALNEVKSGRTAEVAARPNAVTSFWPLVLGSDDLILERISSSVIRGLNLHFHRSDFLP